MKPEGEFPGLICSKHSSLQVLMDTTVPRSLCLRNKITKLEREEEKEKKKGEREGGKEGGRVERRWEKKEGGGRVERRGEEKERERKSILLLSSA